MTNDVFERAKREINLKDYIINAYPVKANGNNGAWSINPNPMDLKSKDNFKISFKEGVWLYNAFNGDEGGTIIDFLEEKEGLKDLVLIEKLNNLLENNCLLKKPLVIEEKKHNQEDVNKLIALIDTSKMEYFRVRGISERLIKKYKLGVSNNGILDMYSSLKMNTHPKMKDHKNIIPCFDECKNLKFLVARNYKDNLLEDDKKTWNIKGISTYFLNQFYLEGHDVVKGDIILISESWGDSLSAESVCKELKVVSLHSTSNVKRLGDLLTINREKFDDVKFIIAFNNDKPKENGQSPGMLATNKAVKIMKDLNLEYEVLIPTKYNDLNEWLLADAEELKGELDKAITRLKYSDRINLSGDVKDAFFSYIGDDLNYIINSDDERRFLYWNKNSWVRKTEEEARIIYGNFIKECIVQFKKNRANGKYSPENAQRMLKKIKSWNNTSKAKECLNLIGMDEELIMDLAKYEVQYHKHVSANGKIINLKDGSIRDTKKEDMILNTNQYKLVNKDEAIEFMEDKVLKVYRGVLEEERLEFILDFLAMKMSGRNYQLAIINIGPSKSGKSMMKNLTTKLYPGYVSQIPYAYLTTSNRGNAGAERDDIIVNLDKKLFALSSEVEKNNEPIAIGRFKNILSNSITDARATGGKMQNGIDLTHLDVIIDTNEMPKFSGYDDAIENRLLFINWQNSIPMEDRIDNFYGEILIPNMDKIWSYFIYRAIDLKDKVLIIPEVIKKDSAERKGELDKFTSNVISKLEYIENSFIELNVLIEELELFKVYPKLKHSRAIHKIVTDKIKNIPGFEGVEQDRKSRKKVNVVKGLRFKEK